jgi:hypothetical protein
VSGRMAYPTLRRGSLLVAHSVAAARLHGCLAPIADEDIAT